MNTITARLGARLAVAQHDAHAVADRLRDERGEGVISTAIAVLIIAIIGVGALAAFRGLVGDAGNRARDQVNSY
jgi:hypothetical protein